MSMEWKADWLESLMCGGMRTGAPATWFRHEFDLPKGLRSAVLHVTALGLWECEINGARVGEDVLAPGWTDYRNRVYVRHYDVRRLLRAGRNAVGVVLGDGWYCGHIANFDREAYGTRPKFILQLDVTTASGRSMTVTSGPGWKAATGPLLENDLIMGETYDARQELGDWSRPGLDEAAWRPAPVVEDPDIRVEDSPGPPIRRHERVRPRRNGTRPFTRGRWHGCLFDFGQNISGRIRITVRGRRGTGLTIRHGEMLDAKGNLYTENLRTARATDQYTLKGGGYETWEPRFTFHGFRYAEIGWYIGIEDVELKRVEAVALYSDMPEIGRFRCSDRRLNRLAENIQWSLKGNFLDIPTDCPQRDERLGWTGDAQVFIRTASLFRDVRGFFRKWLLDMRDAQRPAGDLPRTIPNPYGGVYPPRDGGPAWSDAVFICPWVLCEQTGETDVLEAHYPAMVKHWDWIGAHRVRDHIREHPEIGGWHGYGDWLALDGSGKTTGGTPPDLIGTAFYAEAGRILAETADLLGRAKEAASYRRRRRQIVGAFERRYVTPAGLMACGTQTAYVLALRFGLLPEQRRPAAAAELVRLIRENGNRMATGFVGTPHLLPVLEAHGYLDVAYQLLEQTECPSWLFPVLNGATTIWERWDSWTPERGFHPAGMNSFNHYAYGAVGEWLFSTVAGLVPAAPGYAAICFKPRPGGSLTEAEASLETPRGRAVIAWKRKAFRLDIAVTVPPDTAAHFSMPPGWGGNVPTLGEGRHVFRLRRVESP